MERHRPSLEEGQRSLRDHVVDTAAAARAKHGPFSAPAALQRLLGDSKFVRFPTTIDFDGDTLQTGEFAWAEQLGEHPREGYVIHVHPSLAERPDVLPLVVGYHLVTVNYGDVATHEEAELFGATLVGLEQEAYYLQLCALADGLP